MMILGGVTYDLPFVLTGNGPVPPPPFAYCFRNWANNYLATVAKEFRRTESIRELVHAINYVSVVSDLEAQRWALSEASWWHTYGDDLPKRLRAEIRAFWLSILGGFKKEISCEFHP